MRTILDKRKVGSKDTSKLDGVMKKLDNLENDMFLISPVSNKTDRFRLTWIGLSRVFRMANNYIKTENELNDFDLNTFRYLFNQCTNEEKSFLKTKYNQLYNALFKENSHKGDNK